MHQPQRAGLGSSHGQEFVFRHAVANLPVAISPPTVDSAFDDRQRVSVDRLVPPAGEGARRPRKGDVKGFEDARLFHSVAHLAVGVPAPVVDGPRGGARARGHLAGGDFDDSGEPRHRQRRFAFPDARPDSKFATMVGAARVDRAVLEQPQDVVRATLDGRRARDPRHLRGSAQTLRLFSHAQAAFAAPTPRPPLSGGVDREPLGLRLADRHDLDPGGELHTDGRFQTGFQQPIAQLTNRAFAEGPHRAVGLQHVAGRVGGVDRDHVFQACHRRVRLHGVRAAVRAPVLDLAGRGGGERESG